MSGFTPGPWIQDHRKGSDGMYRTEVFSERHGGIATCEWTPNNLGNGVTETYREANARLIAASPDLLDALKGLDDAFCANDYATSEGRSVGRKALIAARSAIAKATGKAP